jgi:small-conductance mechanosensitive channel
MMYYAILLDTVSIQRYVFSSSKLKENIGASHLVKETLNAFLKKGLEKVFPHQQVDLENWKKEPAKHLIKEDPDVPFEIGYIGGGNALLSFQDSDKARDFIKNWTTNLLVDAPGIETAVAGIPYDPDNFEQARQLLFKKLKENKNKYIPQTVIPRHGITAECSRSGYSLESWYKAPVDEESGYVSAAVKSKIDAVNAANEEINTEFADILGDTHCFTDRLDELGHQKYEDSHIAIVHIDGNGD